MIKYGIIYRVLNTSNGKMYIGQTTQSFDKRKARHITQFINRTHPNKHFTAAYHMYSGAFEWDVIDIAYSKEELDTKEDFWIQYYDTVNPVCGYNKRTGGSAGKFTLDARIRMSNAAKNRIISQETRKKLSIAGKGRQFSDVHRNRIATAKVGSRHLDVSKQKMSHAHRGKRASTETRTKMAQTKANVVYDGFVDPNGVPVPPFQNLKQFCKDNNLQLANMHAVKAGARQSHKGYTYINKR